MNTTLLALVIGFLVFVFWLAAHRGSPTVRGRKGENRVRNYLNRKLKRGVYRQFHDLTLPSGRGNTQIDHVVLSPYGVFVIETKNYSGWIYGDRDSRVWTQTLYGTKYQFQNPLRQNYKHTKAVEAALSLPAEFVHSVVVFVGNAEFRTARPPNVVYLTELHAYIRAHSDPIIGPAGLERATKLLAGFKGSRPVTPEVTVVEPIGTNAPLCRSCKCRMKKRTVREGANRGSQFWGCARYPYCRETRRID